MKALTFAMRSFGRELRSGEVVVLLSAVILAVAALTAVGFLTDRIGKAVERQANEVLAADLRLRSQDPIPDSWRELAAEYELRTADMVSFPTVVFAGDESALTTLLAVDDVYQIHEQRELLGSLKGEWFLYPLFAILALLCWRLPGSTASCQPNGKRPRSDRQNREEWCARFASCDHCAGPLIH